jgi:hypothetical protein
MRKPTSVAVLTGPKANPIRRKTKVAFFLLYLLLVKLHHRLSLLPVPQQPCEKPSPSRLPAIAIPTCLLIAADPPAVHIHYPVAASPPHGLLLIGLQYLIRFRAPAIGPRPPSPAASAAAETARSGRAWGLAMDARSGRARPRERGLRFTDWGTVIADLRFPPDEEFLQFRSFSTSSTSIGSRRAYPSPEHLPSPRPPPHWIVVLGCGRRAV